jgi:SAM-dependent MidA family methyltransferase
LADTSSLKPCPTFVIANEVLDAFPCRLIERDGDEWKEIKIESREEGCQLSEARYPCEMSLPSILCRDEYADGYRTEIRVAPHAFIESLCRCMTRGRILFFDYGFAQPEYYDPQRKNGTLRVYRNHRASEDALQDPGLVDLTAHVDFTLVMETASHAGLKAVSFEPQEFFISCNRENGIMLGKRICKHWCIPLILAASFTPLSYHTQSMTSTMLPSQSA